MKKIIGLAVLVTIIIVVLLQIFHTAEKEIPVLPLPLVIPPVEKKSEPAPIPRAKPGIIKGTEITYNNIFNGINQERYKLGLPILKKSAELNKAAETKLQDMLDQHYFAHKSPSGYYFSNWEDTDYGSLGEILAHNYDTAQETLQAWKESPSHYNVIKSPDYTDIGIAISSSIVVVIFGAKD